MDFSRLTCHVTKRCTRKFPIFWYQCRSGTRWRKYGFQWKTNSNRKLRGSDCLKLSKLRGFRLDIPRLGFINRISSNFFRKNAHAKKILFWFLIPEFNLRIGFKKSLFSIFQPIDAFIFCLLQGIKRTYTSAIDNHPSILRRPLNKGFHIGGGSWTRD